MGNRTAASKKVRAMGGFTVAAIFALLLATSCPVAHADSKTQGSATLHIEVHVVPMVQAQSMAPSPTSFSNDAVSFNLNQQVTKRNMQEITRISPANENKGSSPAILETVTTVAE